MSQPLTQSRFCFFLAVTYLDDHHNLGSPQKEVWMDQKFRGQNEHDLTQNKAPGPKHFPSYFLKHIRRLSKSLTDGLV